MNDGPLDHAKKEAERFLQVVHALNLRRKAEKAKEEEAKRTGQDHGDYLYDFQGCKESAAVRRASLDLTRALADLRR